MQYLDDIDCRFEGAHVTLTYQMHRENIDNKNNFEYLLTYLLINTKCIFL